MRDTEILKTVKKSKIEAFVFFYNCIYIKKVNKITTELQDPKR